MKNLILHPWMQHFQQKYQQVTKLTGIFFACGLLMTGCANILPSDAEPIQTKAFERHIQTISEQWHYPFHRSGRFSVQYEENQNAKSEHVSFDWQETSLDHIIVTLSDPIGGTIAQLEFDGVNNTLTQSNGQIIEGNNPDDLLKKATGLELPVTGLRYWLRGVPRPHQPYEINPKENFGWIQDDWYVTIRQFLPAQNAQVAMPKRLAISRLNPKLDIKLVIQNQ